MSVLIKGMEMPTSCLKCQLERRQDTAYDYEFRCCPVTGAQTNHYRYERHPNCPLVSIPPHGRLIDADEFENFIRKDWDKNDHWIADVVYSRPTIIPPEGNEDGSGQT